MKRLIMALAAATAVAFGFSGAAEAATATAAMNLSGTYAASCSITVPNLNFGTMATPGVPYNVSGAVAVLCSNSTPYSIGIDAGLYVNRLSDGLGHFIPYSGSLSSSAGTGNGVTADSITASFSATPNTNTVPGAYTDVVTTTVSY